MNYQTVGWNLSDGVLTLTLNRPDRLNAFTVQMADELEHAFLRANADNAVRAIVVTGASEQAASANVQLGVRKAYEQCSQNHLVSGLLTHSVHQLSLSMAEASAQAWANV